MTAYTFLFALCSSLMLHSAPRTCAHGDSTLQAHEFYVGLTDIYYNSESSTYEITLKLFSDDLERALSAYSGHKIFLEDVNKAAATDSLIAAYVFAKFAVKVSNTTPLKLEWVGRESEYDVTWIYLESIPAQPLKEMRVSNVLLMELFPDQTHIVHLKQGGATRSALLRSAESIAILKP